MNLENIKIKLAELKQLDRRFSVFVSISHKYSNKPVSLRKIEEFENEFDFVFPENFRGFLLEVGCGAGPNYGILCLEDIYKELSSLIDDLWRDEEVKVSPAQPFPFNKEHINDLQIRISRGERSVYADLPLLEDTYPTNGCIPISHQGCTYWNFLVVTGEFRGSVWDASSFKGYEGLWIPSSFSANVIDFEVWFENWLTKELSNFKNISTKTEIYEENHGGLINRLLSKFWN